MTKNRTNFKIGNLSISVGVHKGARHYRFMNICCLSNGCLYIFNELCGKRSINGLLIIQSKKRDKNESSYIKN